MIFHPVLMSLRDGIKSVAAKDIDVSAPDAMPQTDKFLFGYVGAMQKRATDFKVDQEVKRAVRAIAIEVYKELAVRKVTNEG